MPWNKDDVSRFKSGLTEAQKEQWVEVANSVLQRCLDEGGDQEDCEASAIRQANGVVGNSIVNHTIQIENNVNYRYETFHGQTHIVAPVVLMTEGVHHGSAGRILYTQEELSRMPLTWNGRPAPIMHPTTDDGQPITCNYPSVLEQQNAGWIFNVKWEQNNRRLKGETWINVQRAREICQRLNLPDVVNMIERGDPVEVSTGLHPEQSEPAGVWNGVEYDTKANGITADHLALLPGGRGACSWEDGCGIRNNEKEGLNGMKRTKDPNNNGAGNQNQKASESPQTKEHPLTANQVSEGYSQLLEKVQRKLDSMDDDLRIHFLEELYENEVVYRIRNKDSNEEKFYMRPYSVNEDGSVNFDEEPEQVRKEVDYVPIQQQQQQSDSQTNNNEEKEENMTKENKQANNQNGCCPEKIEAVINSQSNGFTENDREYLTQQNEEFIDKLPVDSQDDSQTQNQTQESGAKDQVDFDTLLANADAETQESIKYGRQMFVQKRNEMIQTIMNASTNQFTEDELKSYGFETLSKIANTVGKPVDHSLGGGNAPSNNAGGESEYEEGLEMPWIQEEKPASDKTQ